ncbi:MAG: DNA repair protein RecN [Actinomycetota bacterium]|nr:DNA repair protein RecN [Actinomycetota bacterium]
MSDSTLLQEITIRSIGVIDQATLELSKGLTVLTGETGAGKTMVLTALNLIVGGKSDSTLVRAGSQRLIASARFAIAEHVRDEIDALGLIVEDGELILTRSVTSDGKSKATSNGISVNLSTLASVSERLVEVHAQVANMNISKRTRQRELLDRYAGQNFEIAFAQYRGYLTAYHELQSRINALRRSIDKADQELVELREFVSALSKFKLTRGEYADISTAIERLSNVEELAIAGASALAAIDDEESGALTWIGVARRALESVRVNDKELEDIFSQMSEGFFAINEARTALATYMHSLEADPGRLDLLNARKSGIRSLIKRYGGDQSVEIEIDLMISRYESSSRAIQDLEGGDNRLKEMESEFIGLKKELVIAAKTLTRLRNEAATRLNTAVTAEIAQLSMPHTNFFVQVESADYSALKSSDFTSQGCDEVEMFISAHKDAPLVALAKGASGGEMSRVMLALEVVLAASHPVGTYVFDEVDAGVGGKAAIEVGRRLHALSRHAQVIVITHLPQVAAWADSHFVVTKNLTGSVSQSDVRKVEGDERIEEIARMLAGLEGSLSAREHAAELLSLGL